MGNYAMQQLRDLAMRNFLRGNPEFHGLWFCRSADRASAQQ